MNRQAAGASSLLLSMLLLFTLLPCISYGQQDPPVVRTADRSQGFDRTVEYVEGEVIVRFRSDVSRDRRERFRSQFGVREHRILTPDSLYHLRLDSEDAENLIHLRQILHPDLEYLQPNYVYRLDKPEVNEGSAISEEDQEQGVIPDDPEFYRQWALLNDGQLYRGRKRGSPGADIDATRAWEVSTGSPELIVAVFDTGIDYEHPDLADNMFQDSHGRYGADCSPEGMTNGVCGNDPMDDHGHGTHVAGIIGAVGDNATGVAGVNWQVQLMAIRVFSEDPNNPNEQFTTTSSILAGYEYAISNGAQLSNHSYGGPNQDFAQRERIRLAGEQGHLVVAAAGNRDENSEPDSPIYPAGYDLENVIAVAATDASDRLAEFSRYGSHVDIAAPGSEIYSTHLSGDYRYSSGTSMATPHVSGAVGLIYSVFPLHSVEQVRRLLLDQADPLASLEEYVEEGRRLNAWRSLSVAEIQFTHALAALQSVQVRVEINNGERIRELSFGETSDRVKVLAGSDLELTVYSVGDGPVAEPVHHQTVNLARDQTVGMVLAGRREAESEGITQTGGEGSTFFQYEYIEPAVANDRTAVTFLNALEDHESVGLYAFWPELRPPLQIMEGVSFGNFYPDTELPAEVLELDVTRGDDRLGTYRFSVEATAGESGLIVLFGGGEEESGLLYSTGEGPGMIVGRVSEPVDRAGHRPDVFTLEDNFPNPFRGATSIQFSLPEEREVTLEIFDVTGRRVQRLLGEQMSAGIHRVRFDAAGLSSGMYIYRVRAGEEMESGMMMLVR